MKVLMLTPKFYTLQQTIARGFTNLGYNVYHYDYRDDLAGWQQKTKYANVSFPGQLSSKMGSLFYGLDQP